MGNVIVNRFIIIIILMLLFIFTNNVSVKDSIIIYLCDHGFPLLKISYNY